MSKSLYEVIGVSPNADVSLIEEKCLELGKKYHPDSNANDLDAAIKYKEVMLAYATLRDSIKRAEYDASIKTNNINNPIPNITKVFENILGSEKPRKEVSLLFAVAIVFVPYISAWFLLKDGYSRKARIISFGWLTLFALIYFKPEPEPLTPAQQAEMQAKQEIQEGVARQRQQVEEFEEKQQKTQNRVKGTWKSAVTDLLVDPKSADFKDVVFVLDVSGTAFACGEVNSKNRLGGYTGYKGFITAGLKEYTYIEGETEGFSKFWNEVCVKGQQI